MNTISKKRSGEQPLEGITIVDITQVVAGPYATMLLADLGAEVVKIEAVGRGDRSRGIQPIPEYFDSVNRNKRSIAVNLKTDSGQEVVNDIVRNADVFIESMKPGRADTFNLGYNDLVEINSELIYCSIDGFGRNSPYENVAAWDMLIQAMSGFMSMTGEEDGPPLWSGLPSGDLAAAMFVVQSTLAALYAQERGQITTEWIEVPMLDAAISWLTVRAGYTFGTDKPFPRLGAHHPSTAPFGVYECVDENIVIAAGTDSLWEDLCSVLEREDLINDERFETTEDRAKNIQELDEIINAELSDETADHWIERLHDADVPAGPIYDTKTVWEDEHVKQRQLHQVMERKEQKNANVVDHPIHFSELATRLDRPPEKLGESTEDILAQCGYDKAKINELRENEIIE